MTVRCYARVSGLGQDLDIQIKELKNSGYANIAMYSEKITGTKIERKEFTRLLKDLKRGDTLVVTKLDRFARSTSDAINTIKELFERGVRVHVLNMGIMEDTPTGRLMFTVISAFAEFERDMIVERTQTGKAAAKERLGDAYKEGRPKKWNPKKVRNAVILVEQGNSYKEVSQLTGIPLRTLEREVKIYRDSQKEKEINA